MKIAKGKGFMLVLVIGVGSLLFLAGIAAVSISSQDALQQRYLEHSVQARCAADTAIARAMDKLTSDPNWQGSLRASQDGWRYALGFQPGEGINNVAGKETVKSNGRQVPIGCVCLASTGSLQGCNVNSGAVVSLGEELFDDNFSQPATGWQSNSPNLTIYLLGKWVLDLKLLTQTYLAKGDEHWRNYTYEVTVLLSQVTDMGFVVRAQGAPAKMSGYVVGYNLLEDLLRGGTFYLSRIENGRFVERIQEKHGNSMGLGGLVWLLNLYHTYKITVDGSTIVATVDGKEIINATVKNPIKNGRVGLLPGLLSTMLVDRARVVSLPEVRSRWRTL